jgi:hypothetical protein
MARQYMNPDTAWEIAGEYVSENESEYTDIFDEWVADIKDDYTNEEWADLNTEMLWDRFRDSSNYEQIRQDYADQLTSEPADC